MIDIGGPTMLKKKKEAPARTPKIVLVCATPRLWRKPFKDKDKTDDYDYRMKLMYKVFRQHIGLRNTYIINYLAK